MAAKSFQPTCSSTENVNVYSPESTKALAGSSTTLSATDTAGVYDEQLTSLDHEHKGFWRVLRPRYGVDVVKQGIELDLVLVLVTPSALSRSLCVKVYTFSFLARNT